MINKVYFAGALFDHKHLIGNRLLADAINASAPERYRVILPQETEFPEQRAVAIRNADLRLLLETQAAIFNFDGTELDSGTVVEFMVAKMIDLPCVIIRTDFRHAGDQEPEGEPWNLMCSGYPRSEGLNLHAMALYQQHLKKNENGAALLTAIYNDMGPQVVEKLDTVMKQPSWLSSASAMEAAYRQVITAAGGGLAAELPGDLIERAVAARMAL